jgi:hypothetical protein
MESKRKYSSHPKEGKKREAKETKTDKIIRK